MFGTSDIIEGTGDLTAAITGQGLDQRSCNPARDTLFGGNELIYAGAEVAVSLGTTAAASKALASTSSATTESLQATSGRELAREAEAASYGSKIVGEVKTIGGFGEYSTKIDAKVTVVEKMKLPEALAKTFTDGQYRTVVTNEEITVYRVFGGRADAGGGFATTTPALSRIESKIDFALLPEWGNSRAYEAKIIIPKGTELNIGNIASQEIKETGTVLKGGLDQILMPMNWPLEWIEGIRRITF